MKINFGYGKTYQSLEIQDKNLISCLKANNIEHKYKGTESVNYALNHPIKAKKISEYNLFNKKIAIITSDISRPLPSWEILPQLLVELYKAKANPENITIVLALGSHRNHTEEEKKHLVGNDVYKKIKTIDSDINNCVSLGKTKNGTPIDFDKNVCEADFKIALGNVEFHYFAGYSGGYKALMPGVSTIKAIQENHRLMTHPKAIAGNLENNPLRNDINEAGEKLGLDYIINVVLDEHKNIVYTAAGNVYEAHINACKYLDKMYRCQIPEKADIVIVSQGGAPKDANLYQTQKALENSKYAVKNGGTIIVVGACNEGCGSKKFEEWLVNAKESSELIKKVETNFELGGHKAAAICLILEYANIDLVSEMDSCFVKQLFLTPRKNLKEAYDIALKKYGKNAKVIAMPYGGSTLPILKKLN